MSGISVKTHVIYVRVENSLDNATKTIESWGRGGRPGGCGPGDMVRVGLPPRVVTTDGHGGRLPYISSIADNPSPYCSRALTPTFPIHYADTSTQSLLDKPRVVPRPTPLRYTLPARGSQHIFERTLPISSLSSPHIAMRDPPPPPGAPPPSVHPHHGGRLYVDSQQRHPPSPFEIGRAHV